MSACGRKQPSVNSQSSVVLALEHCCTQTGACPVESVEMAGSDGNLRDSQAQIRVRG